MSDQFLRSTVSLRSVVRWQFQGIHGDGSTHVPGRGSPAARWSLELAEKVSNYLNICRIHKSSRSPASPQVSSDATQPLERWPSRNAKTRTARASYQGTASAVPIQPDSRAGLAPAQTSTHIRKVDTSVKPLSNGQFAHPTANPCGPPWPTRTGPPANSCPYTKDPSTPKSLSGTPIARHPLSLLEHSISSIPPPAPPSFGFRQFALANCEHFYKLKAAIYLLSQLQPLPPRG